MSVSPSPFSSPSLLSEERLIAVEAALAEERARTAKLQAELEAALAERDRLRASHERLRLELELMRRRIFVAKAERVDTTQLELEFKDKLAELEKLAGTAEPSDARPGDDGHPDDGGGGGAGGKGRKTKPTGRRDLRKAPLEEERIELNDPLFEALVAEGKAERIGYEESSKLAWKRGGLRRLVVGARGKTSRRRRWRRPLRGRMLVALQAKVLGGDGRQERRGARRARANRPHLSARRDISTPSARRDRAPAQRPSAHASGGLHALGRAAVSSRERPARPAPLRTRLRRPPEGGAPARARRREASPRQ